MESLYFHLGHCFQGQGHFVFLVMSLEEKEILWTRRTFAVKNLEFTVASFFFPLLLIRWIFDFFIALHSKQICLPNCVQLVVFPFRQIASTGRYDSSWLKDKLNGTSPIPTKLLSYVWSHWDHPIEVIVIVTCRTKPNCLLCYFHQYLSVYVHLSDIGIFIVYICPQASAFPLVQLFPHASLRFPLHNNFCLWNITSLMYLSE